jgi:hypothetical protein
VVLDKKTCDINRKWQIVLNEQKNQQIQIHPFTPSYTHCHMRLFWSLLKANDVLPRIPIINLLLLLLFWNNLGGSIHMFGWIILWHMDKYKYATWH